MLSTSNQMVNVLCGIESWDKLLSLNIFILNVKKISLKNVTDIYSTISQMLCAKFNNICNVL
jgi:hypothetical protein